MLASNKKIPKKKKKSDKNGKGDGAEGQLPASEGSTFTINPTVALPVAVVPPATADGGTASLLLVGAPPLLPVPWPTNCGLLLLSYSLVIGEGHIRFLYMYNMYDYNY